MHTKSVRTKSENFASSFARNCLVGTSPESDHIYKLLDHLVQLSQHNLSIGSEKKKEKIGGKTVSPYNNCLHLFLLLANLPALALLIGFKKTFVLHGLDESLCALKVFLGWEGI